MTTTLEFKYKLKDMSNVFTQQALKFQDSLNLIQIDLDQIANDDQSIVSRKGAQQALLEKDSIETIRLNDCNTLLNKVKISSDQIIDLIRGNSIDSYNNSNNNEFVIKTNQMSNSLQLLKNNLNDLKIKFQETCLDFERQEAENEKYKSNEQDSMLLDEIQTRIAQL